MIVAVMLAACLVVAPVVPSTPPPTFDALVERARVDFQAQRYDEAAASLRRAFELSDEPDVLLNWANAERLAGRCDDAIVLYERYLALAAPSAAGDAVSQTYVNIAEQRRAECAEEIANAPVAPVPAVEPQATVAVTPQPPAQEVSEPAAPPVQPRATADVSPKNYDPLGLALTSIGAVSLLTGAGLVGVAYVSNNQGTAGVAHRAYRDRVRQAQGMAIGGWTMLGVGAALAVGGVVRLVLVRRGRRHSPLSMRGPASLRLRF